MNQSGVLADYVREIRERVDGGESAVDVWRDLRKRGVRVHPSSVSRVAYGATYVDEGVPPAAHPWDILTKTEAIEVYKLYQLTDWPVEVIADAFEINPATVYHVGNGRTRWSWLRDLRLPPRVRPRLSGHYKISPEEWSSIKTALEDGASPDDLAEPHGVTPDAIYMRLMRERRRLQRSGRTVPEWMWLQNRKATQKGVLGEFSAVAT